MDITGISLRRSVVTSALSLALIPHLVGALGLGDIHTQSALNEPFVGEIELLDMAPDELDTIKVLLASKAEFDKASTERPQFLTGLEFEPQASSEGRAHIRVTSRRPIREPFLDFLIEINWPQGRLVKAYTAYTVLLDPPATSNRRSPKGEQPAVRLPSQTPSSEVAGPGTSSVQEILLQVQEANEHIRREIGELRGRIRALETQLADTRRLPALDNQGDAVLQQAQPAQFEGPDAEPDIPLSEPEAMQASEATRGREATAMPTTGAVPAPAKPADVEPTSDPEHPWWESTPWSALALTLALAFLLPGWIRRRRHQHREEVLMTLREPPVLETPDATAAGVTEADPAERTPAGPATTPTLLSSRSGDPDGETEETGLVAEADIYIAYGQYREAETLLKKALEKSPHRLDVKYKLLEAYHGVRDRQHMEALMDQMQRTEHSRIDPDQWQRLNAMLEDLKDTAGPHPTAAIDGEETLAAAGAEPTNHREPIFPPPTPPDPAPQPGLETDAWAPGVTDAPDATQATWPRTTRT